MSIDDFKQQIEEEKAKIEKEPINSEIQSEDVQSIQTSELTTEQTDPFLDEALKMGFNPNYQGPNKKTPEQFVKDGSFFRKIDAQHKEIQDLKMAIRDLTDHTMKVEQISYQKGMSDALTKRAQAVEAGDLEAFNKAEQEINILNAQVKSEPAKSQQPQTPITQDMLDFVKTNETWFNNQTPENSAMVAEADITFTYLKQSNPTKSDKELLGIVTSRMQKLYPEKFENPNKNKPAVVSKSTAASSGNQNSLAAKLTDRQRKTFKLAKEVGSSLSIEDYARQLKATGDLKDE